MALTAADKLYSYLHHRLDYEDIGGLNMDDETQEINIYAINYEKIIDLLKQYDGEIVSINFIETDYSYADLIDIVSKINALPVVQNNIEILRFISPCLIPIQFGSNGRALILNSVNFRNVSIPRYDYFDCRTRTAPIFLLKGGFSRPFRRVAPFLSAKDSGQPPRPNVRTCLHVCGHVFSFMPHISDLYKFRSLVAISRFICYNKTVCERYDWMESGNLPGKRING